jgi:chromosome segregation ATPase
MKNSTILKDEVGILTADKSAVITELRIASQKLKDVHIEIGKAEATLADVRTLITEETARLEDIRGRAVSCKSELNILMQDLRNMQNSYDAARVRNSQEERIHLGRIKELKEQEGALISEIANLKTVYDKNSDAYAMSMSEQTRKLRDIDKELSIKEKLVSDKNKELDKMEEESKKLTKERLKREDKIRARERILDSRELSLTKKEEDLITMSRDMLIVYGRLKEAYAKVDPAVDLDKLIFK